LNSWWRKAEYVKKAPWGGGEVFLEEEVVQDLQLSGQNTGSFMAMTLRWPAETFICRNF